MTEPGAAPVDALPAPPGVGSPVPGPAGNDPVRYVEDLLAGLPQQAPLAEQVRVLEQAHDVLARALGEANG